MNDIAKPLTAAQHRALAWVRKIADESWNQTLNRPSQAVLDRLREANLITFEKGHKIAIAGRGVPHLPQLLIGLDITAAGRVALTTKADLTSLVAGQQVRLPHGNRVWLQIEAIGSLLTDGPRRRYARVRRANDNGRTDSYDLILHDYTYAVRGTL